MTELIGGLIVLFFVVFYTCIILLIRKNISKSNKQHFYDYSDSYADKGSGSSSRNRPRKVSLRPGGYGEDKAKSYNDGYKQGMEDAIYGDRYRYTRGGKGSDSFKSGYQRGFEEYED